MRLFGVHICEFQVLKALVGDAMNMAGVGARWKRCTTRIVDDAVGAVHGISSWWSGPKNGSSASYPSGIERYGKHGRRIQELSRVRVLGGQHALATHLLLQTLQHLESLAA